LDVAPAGHGRCSEASLRGDGENTMENARFNGKNRLRLINNMSKLINK
jgi:hypothetical protein